jgi:uncharacterized membrane protein
VDPTVAHRQTGAHDLLTPLLLVLLVGATIAFLWNAGSDETIFLTIHVTAAVVWVGGGAMLTIFALLTERARDAHALAGFVRRVETIGLRVFTPASLVTLAFGFALVEKLQLGYGSFWIDFALAAWELSFVLGAAVLGPRTGRLCRLIDERGADDPLVQQGITQLLRLARIDSALLLLVVVDMAAKPTF